RGGWPYAPGVPSPGISWFFRNALSSTRYRKRLIRLPLTPLRVTSGGTSVTVTGLTSKLSCRSFRKVHVTPRIASKLLISVPIADPARHTAERIRTPQILAVLSSAFAGEQQSEQETRCGFQSFRSGHERKSLQALRRRIGVQWMSFPSLVVGRFVPDRF